MEEELRDRMIGAKEWDGEAKGHLLGVWPEGRIFPTL